MLIIALLRTAESRSPDLIYHVGCIHNGFEASLPVIHGFSMCTVVGRSLLPFTTGPQCSSLFLCLPPCASQLFLGIVFMLPFLLQTEQKPKPLLGTGSRGTGYSLDWVSPNHPGGMGRVTLAWKDGGTEETGTKTETESVGSADKAGPAWLGGQMGRGQSGGLSRLLPRGPGCRGI